mmetsp:Transcript_7762/g.13409  ORF Transcript_7762/g.13409 Transcript_7762/m.13409 type:complete len:218 (+) Transcript_7762:105-758(+)
MCLPVRSARTPSLSYFCVIHFVASLVTQFCSSPIQSSPSSVWEANFSMSPRCSEMNWPRSSTRVTALITSPMMILWTTAPIKKVRTTYRISPGVTAAMSPKPTVVKTVSIKYIACSHCKPGSLSSSKFRSPKESTYLLANHVSWGLACRDAHMYQPHARRWTLKKRPTKTLMIRTPRNVCSHFHSGLFFMAVNLASRPILASRKSREARCKRIVLAA